MRPSLLGRRGSRWAHPPRSVASDRAPLASESARALFRSTVSVRCGSCLDEERSWSSIAASHGQSQERRAMRLPARNRSQPSPRRRGSSGARHSCRSRHGSTQFLRDSLLRYAAAVQLAPDELGMVDEGHRQGVLDAMSSSMASRLGDPGSKACIQYSSMPPSDASAGPSLSGRIARAMPRSTGARLTGLRSTKIAWRAAWVPADRSVARLH
jgi:hypothetical protein